MLKRGKDKDKGKDKGRDPKKSTSSIASAPDPLQQGYEQFDSMNPPDPNSEDMEMSPIPPRGSAVAVTPERPSTSGSEQGVEPETRERSNTVDGATGEVREKAKKGSKWRHRPDFMKKIIPKDKDRLPSSTSSAGDPPQLSSGAEAAQDPSCVEVFSPDIEEEMRAECREDVEAERRAEVEAMYKEEMPRLKQVEEIMHAQLKKQFEADLEEEKRKMATQNEAQIDGMKQKCDLILSLKAKEIREKEAEIKSLKAKNEELASLSDAHEVVKKKLADVSEKERYLRRENVHAQEQHKRTTEELVSTHEQQLQKLEEDHQQQLGQLEEKLQHLMQQLGEEHQHQLHQLEEELTQQMRGEGEREVADLQEKLRGLEAERAKQDRQFVVVYQDRDHFRHELEKKCQEVQDVQATKEVLEMDLQDAKEKLTQEIEAKQAMTRGWELQQKELADKLQEQLAELTEKERTIQELKSKQLSPPPPMDQHVLRELEQKCGVLENENQKLRMQVGQPLPSNVYHFSKQLSKFVDPEGETAETTSRPIMVENILPILQAMGCGSEYKPRGYVLALFHGANQAQSVLLDYTRIGEVVQLKASSDRLDASDSGEEIEKSPYSSLNEVKVEVTEGNMTDADKIELQRLLRESQEELENLRTENKKLLERLGEQDHLNNTDPPTDDAPVPTDQGEKANPQTALKALKQKYLQLHNEKMQLVKDKEQLLEKLEERDVQLKQLRKENSAAGVGLPIERPDMERSLSTGDMQSPDDPKVEVLKLRKVIEERDKKIHNLAMQLKSFDAVASGNVTLEEETAKLREQLEEAQAEIKKLSDRSELVQVYNTLRTEVCEARESLKKSDHDREDLEAERNIWENEISAEKDNNQALQNEVARLKAALRFYETKYPQGDAENVLDDIAMEEHDKELKQQMHQIEVLDLQTKIRQREASIKNLAKCRNTLESRLLRAQEERDRLAEQVITLTSVKANLKGELSRFDEVKHNVDKMREFATQLQQSVKMKTAEATSLKKQKEAMTKEIQLLKDEIEARKQEAALIKEDYEQQSVGVAKLKAQEQKYQKDLQELDRRSRHHAHESEQKEYKLNIKLDEKTAELKRVTDSARACQRELDEQCEQLRQERDNLKMERERYKEERDVLQGEFNRALTLHEEQKAKHKAEIDDKEEEQGKLQETVNFVTTKCSSLEDHVRLLEDTALKKEKQYELTATKYQQLKNQLEVVIQEKATLDSQYRRELAEWQANRDELERAVNGLSEQVKTLQHLQNQVEVLRGRLQDEKKKVTQSQRDLRLAQEQLQKKDEEQSSHIEILQAQHESEKMEQERLMLPLRRELEQLRSQKFGEGQFAETYRRMDAERKELRLKLEASEEKYDAMVDEYTVARDLLIQNNLPLPKKNKGQYDQQQLEANVRQPNIMVGYQPQQCDYNVHPYNPPPEQPLYPPTATEGRNYAPQQPNQPPLPPTEDRNYALQQVNHPPPASSEARSYGQSPYHHLGDSDRPLPASQYPRAGENELQQGERSYYTSDHITNRPPENRQNYPNRKAVSKSGYLNKPGPTEYDKQVARQAQEKFPHMQQGGVQQVQGSSNYGLNQGVAPLPPQEQQYLQGSNQAYNQPPQHALPSNSNAGYFPASSHAPQGPYPPGPAPGAAHGPTNAQSRDPAPPSPGRGRQEQQPHSPPQHHPPPTNVNASPQGGRRTIPSGPQENVLMQGLDADISQAAADVRREVFTSMTSIEGSSGGEEPRSLPRLDSNLICPMCKRQFRIGQIQHFRSHVDNCQGQ